ncbi:DUF3311 domain-containing protein [Actinomadura sp. KC06]|uniref:DUF3311 domain-containing protein n=1 Tax=Actinomadura sp. KC06 TaxID=2530369 RepID=UPI001FB72ABA|nr:DUF3311 domain-containing protein [Actinomadura sp. KC06]
MAPENPEGPDSEGPDSKDADSSPPPPPSAGRSDRSPWNWLLVLPVAVPLMTFIYNSDEPRLAGFPAFYWIQLAFILLGVSSTVVVYRMTRKRG